MALPHRRPDGTYVIEGPRGPYHVTRDDPMFAAVAAELDGKALDAEPGPRPLPPRRPARLTDMERVALTGAVQALVDAKLITAERAAEILA